MPLGPLSYTLENFDDIHDLYHLGLALGALAQAAFSWWE
jgi:hypothetical protein